jgi:hypothetical protein
VITLQDSGAYAYLLGLYLGDGVPMAALEELLAAGYLLRRRLPRDHRRSRLSDRGVRPGVSDTPQREEGRVFRRCALQLPYVG